MKRFKDILCVATPGEARKSVLDRAVRLADNNQAGLAVVDVIPRITAGIGLPEGGPISVDLQEAMARDHEQKLETLVEPYRKEIKIQTKVLAGTSFLEIIREVLRSGHDLVIKAPLKTAWLDRLIGSDDMHLLRKCPCPVWLIKPGAPTSYRRVLAAVDVGDAYPEGEIGTNLALNNQILEMATSLALSDFAELHVAHIWEALGEYALRGGVVNMPEEKINAYIEQVEHQRQYHLDHLVQSVGEKMGPDALAYLTPQTHLIKGRASKEIPALAKELAADLIVMGTVARTGISGFFIGNTAETILGQIDCSVLAIKPPGFRTPVTVDK